MAERIVIVSSADRHYARPLTVLFHSILTHVRPDLEIEFHVLDGGVTRWQKRRITRSLKPGRWAITWHAMKAESGVLAGFPVFGHVSLATYYRLLIPRLVKSDKAIYIDADTVVLKDIGSLWAESVQGCHLLAVQEGSVTSAGLLPGVKEYGLPPDHPRLSAGVLVMNLDAWRRDDPFEELRKYLLRFGGQVQFWDQDALNIVLADRWRAVPRCWNYLVDCGTPLAGSRESFLDRLRKEACIVHYASSTKPWHYYADHPAKEIYFKALDETVWRGWRPRPPLKALMNRYFWTGLARRWVRSLCRVGAGKRPA
jgi:lipopolysaccharide biosynthesis glycosyltransferase